MPLELVDHLAKGIEEQMTMNPYISFNQAIEIEFKKFGVFGFQDVVKEKTKAMEKRYWKIVFQMYKQYFKTPQISLVVLCTSLVFIFMRLLPIQIGQYVLGVALMVVFAVFLFATLHSRRKNKKEKRKWLLKELIASHGNVFSFLSLVFQVLIFPDFMKWPLESNIGTFILAFLIVITFILFHILVNIIPSKADELLETAYPEYKFTSGM